MADKMTTMPETDDSRVTTDSRVVRCTLCGTAGPEEDAKFLPLYVNGSEGVIACIACRIALTDCARHLLSVAGKCRMAGYKACKQAHAANAHLTGPNGPGGSHD